MVQKKELNPITEIYLKNMNEIENIKEKTNSIVFEMNEKCNLYDCETIKDLKEFGFNIKGFQSNEFGNKFYIIVERRD